jgi:hypothetical protein
MTNTHTLTRHRDIQTWVSTRNGSPAMLRTPSTSGHVRSRLSLRFSAEGRPVGMPKVDQGASPVSWNAWLAELDRQQLALLVSEDDDTTYELIERKSLN